MKRTQKDKTRRWTMLVEGEDGFLIQYSTGMRLGLLQTPHPDPEQKLQHQEQGGCLSASPDPFLYPL